MSGQRSPRPRQEKHTCMKVQYKQGVIMIMISTTNALSARKSVLGGGWAVNSKIAAWVLGDTVS